MNPVLLILWLLEELRKHDSSYHHVTDKRVWDAADEVISELRAREGVTSEQEG